MKPVELVHRNPTAEEFNRLRGAAEWPVPELRTTEAAMRNTLFAVCAIVDDQVVGMGRIVGDGTLIDYIQDMIVMPEFQGQGIGARIMDAMMDWLKQNASAGSDVALICAPGKEGFYEKWGFKVFKPNIPGMRRTL